MAFDLGSIQTGIDHKAPRVVVYGGDGLGKSTFASQAPSPIFIQTEDGLGEIDCAKFPLCKTYEEALEQLKVVYQEEHDYKTLVIDSIDWLEKLLKTYIAKKGDEKGTYEKIDDIGYGKGYSRMADEFGIFLNGLTSIRDKGMAVIAIAHAKVEQFSDPMSEPYDRYQIDLHKGTKTKGTQGLLKEWADVIGFVAQEFVVRKDEEGGRGKKARRGVATGGGSVLHLRRTPAFDAKCRYKNMPDVIPLDWGAFADAMDPETK